MRARTWLLYATCALLLTTTLMLLHTTRAHATAAAATVVAAGNNNDDGDECAQHVYASQCLASGRCSWCCEAPFGSQCFATATPSPNITTTTTTTAAPFATRVVAPRAHAQHRLGDGGVWPPVRAPTTCAAVATLTRRGQTCAQACRDAGASCDACEQRRWCYFCTASSTCQDPDALCRGASVVQQCRVVYDDDAVVAFGKRLLCGGLVMMLTSLLLTSTVCALSCYREHRHRRRLAAPEQQPLLGGAESGDSTGNNNNGNSNSNSNSNNNNHATATAAAAAAAVASDGASRALSLTDDEYVCYLCLAARSTVTFLPCHHTCCCEACSNRLRPNAHTLTCPFCRCDIEAMVSLPNVLCAAAQRMARSATAAAATLTATTAAATMTTAATLTATTTATATDTPRHEDEAIVSQQQQQQQQQLADGNAIAPTDDAVVVDDATAATPPHALVSSAA